MSSSGRITERYSVGIACCKIVNTIPYILLVRKRVSYAYFEFVHGKYKSINSDDILKLLNNMTVDEKITLSSLDFMAIWYRVWLDKIPNNINFFLVKSKFEKNFCNDDGNRIKKLLSLSTSLQPVWEIPKGRKEKNEADITCAIREFSEETGLTKNKYKLLAPAHRNQTIIDGGVKYFSKYYIAKAEENVEPVVKFLDHQISEIAEVRWMNINEIRLVDHNKHLEILVKPIMNYVKKHGKAMQILI